MTSFIDAYAIDHFGKRRVAKLKKLGMKIVGATVAPDMSKDLPMASGIRLYEIDDNGTMRLKSYLDVLGLLGER